MSNPGALPTVEMADDYLEAPSSEPTILGGFHGPCIDLPPRRPSLVELLDWWCDATWGGDS